MLIGVDGTCWANERGYGRFAREVMKAMVEAAPDDQFRVFVDDASLERFKLESANVEYIRVNTSVAAARAASAGGFRRPADILAMSLAVARNRTDVFFSPSVYTYFPLPPGTRSVVTIHDAIAERFPSLTLPSLRARTFWRMKLRMALGQASRILTVSDYAADDIARIDRIPEGRIDVATEAPADSFIPRGEGEIREERIKLGLAEDDRWFIYVGGFNPHKNIESIIRSHAEVVNRMGSRAPHLLLVGTLRNDVFFGDLAGARAEIDRAGTSSLVHWTGFLPDRRLSALHTGAIALLIPSEAEGFGLPAVEAAACGCPAIATIESPLPGLLEGGGIFVKPRDDVALADAMYALATDDSQRSSMAKRAIERAADLTWDKCARSVLASLRAAAA
jgi:glycosyltransferase involved in cell wall biosynthesis